MTSTMVVLGFVVRKQWKEEIGGKVRRREKTISPVFTVRAAAEKFRELAEKDARENPVRGQTDVRFFVVGDMGDDGLPPGV